MVDLPGELEVHHIGQAYILGRLRDERGVAHVRRHVLDQQAD